MGNMNYSKMSTQPKQEEIASQAAAKVEEEIASTPDEVEVPTTVTGRIINCGKLNIRYSADAQSKVLCTVDVGSELTVHSETLPDEWFKVTTKSGVEGYCMSKYIAIEQ